MHRSGITVDDELKKEFVANQKAENILYVKIRIVDDKFKKIGHGVSTGSVASDFQTLSSLLRPGEPCYLVTRLCAPPNKWMLVFYVPEDSPVRDKMLYSSSCSSLKEGLGGALFVTDYAISHASECSEAAFRHATQEVKAEEVMTSDERITKQELEATHLAKGAGKSAGLADLPISFSPQLQQAVQGLKNGSVEMAVAVMDAKCESLTLEATGRATLDEVAKRMPSKEPRYALLHFKHEHDGKAASSLVFMYYCPDDSAPRLKMTYSTVKSVALKICSQLGLQVDKQFECSEIAEITNANLLYVMYPPVNEKKAISKPKKPGRSGAAPAVKFDANKK